LASTLEELAQAIDAQPVALCFLETPADTGPSADSEQHRYYGDDMGTGRRRIIWLAALLQLWLLTACGGSNPSSAQSITLYTCVNDTTIQPVLAQYQGTHPGTKVELFRAPTGQLNARVASDIRAGGLKADVIWACDPLTMQDYVTQGLVGGWTPETEIPATVRTPDYVGIAMLYLVAITHQGVKAPTSWSDLASAGKVAVPDPNLAASALGALGFFGPKFYADLKEHGAVQVGTPDDVTTGVAQGTYDAGITIANSAYAAQKKGSPITITWPKPGAVAIYGPVAISKTTKNAQAAQDFISYVTSRDGQTVIGSAGSYPTLPDVAGPEKPKGAPVVYPDWNAVTSHKAALLEDYAKIFGG
jgi:iron(III) transport system substrate-binding protein